MVEISFGVFAFLALALFRFLPTGYAVAATCFGGWLLLPVGNYPPGSAFAIFPYWITGIAIPSDMLLTKMWWSPLIALAGAALTDRTTISRFRLDWVDLPIIAWCLWPLVQGLIVVEADPRPWISSLYLSAAWGVPWLLGRVYFSGIQGYQLFIEALTASLIAILPIAIIEGAYGPKVYGWLYELHPFRFDGIERYVGYRPLGFFEDGNQYGIWVATTALAAFWLPFYRDRSQTRPWQFLLTFGALLIALASQSIGAIILLFVGLLISAMVLRGGFRWIAGLALLLLLTSGAVYLSGKLPLRSLAENSGVGRHLVDLLRSLGRGSFTWRIARDQGALALLETQATFGTGRWDWWREGGQRPWSLLLLVVGQFGVVGLLLASGSFGAFCFRLASRRDRAAAPLVAIVCMAIGDGLLNSFFFYPAIVAAGALATGKHFCRSDAQSRSSYAEVRINEARSRLVKFVGADSMNVTTMGW